MIFLDTDIISFYVSGKKELLNHINEAFDNDETLCTTLINKYEIIKGFRWKENQKKEILYIDSLQNLTMFSIDENVIDLAAKIYANIRKKGKTISDADILIAAIVLANNGTLVTNNAKHFEHIEGLKMVNWI